MIKLPSNVIFHKRKASPVEPKARKRKVPVKKLTGVFRPSSNSAGTYCMMKFTPEHIAAAQIEPGDLCKIGVNLTTRDVFIIKAEDGDATMRRKKDRNSWYPEIHLPFGPGFVLKSVSHIGEAFSFVPLCEGGMIQFNLPHGIEIKLN